MDRIRGRDVSNQMKQMNPEQLKPALVMRAIADDYEDLDMITREVIEWGRERKLSITASEVSVVLVQLIESGLAKAFHLSPLREFPGVPDAQKLGDCYFGLTQHGLEQLTRLLPDVWIPADFED